MRRAIFAVLVLMTLVFFLGSVSAISTSIKDSYSPGETIITEISGDIRGSITSSNVKLERISNISGSPIFVPRYFELKKLGESYYLWFDAPEPAENYTLTIKNITTVVSGKVQEIKYQRNFSVSGNLTDYSVSPGFISTNKSFQINAKLNEDYDKQIDLEFLKKTKTTLKPGENTLEFSISGINQSGLLNLSVGKYTLPIYVQVGKKTGVSNVSNATEINEPTNATSTENVTSEEEEIVNEEAPTLYCSEYPGKKCNANETCSGGEEKKSLDSLSCCVSPGDCVLKKTGAGSAWIGYLIAAIIIIVIIFIWIRYKRVKAEKNPVIQKAMLADKKVP